MAIKLQNKRSAEFSSVSMADLVFLLLIFFMVTSTLVSPNVINLLLPRSDAGKQLATGYIEVYIDADINYYINPQGQHIDPIPYEELLYVLQGCVQTDPSDQHIIILRADKSVALEYVVAFYDVLNLLNAELDETQRYKLLLATQSKS
jgi:biopolymer transport protein ExbD